jgi:hypothetical protein
MPRKSPQELATELRARAAKLERKARIATDPVLKAAIKLREMIREGESAKQDALLDALYVFIAEPE